MTSTDDLTADLRALDGWLKRYAPASHRTLLPGADSAGLAALEARYGFALHPELRTLLSWHDGCQRTELAVQIWTDYVFENSDDMYDRWLGPHNEWDSRWVPFASDLGLNTLVVDHATAPGQVLLIDGVNGTLEHPTWPSLGHLIAQVTEALITSSVLNGRQAVVEDGYMRWPEAR